MAETVYIGPPWNAGWSSLVARQAHNLKAAGSNPAPATKRLMPLYRVHVLQSREGRFYVGLSDDIEKRRVQHNSGGSRWTKTCVVLGLSRGKVRTFRLAMPASWKIV